MWKTVSIPGRRDENRKNERMLLRIFGYLFSAGVIVFLAVAGGVAFYLNHILKELPDYTTLRNYEPKVMTRLHASNGLLMAEYAEERRMFLPIQAIPEKLTHAFLSAEDKNFRQHIGLDFRAIARAVITNLQNWGRRPIGASTITQQVAKNLLLVNVVNDERRSRGVSYERKIKEAILALRIEQTFSKDRILELYLNEIFFGLKAHGIAAASLVYFNKPVQDLSLSEMAYLAALPKAPNNYHPFKKRQRAIERRNWVLDRMVENRYISEEDAARAKQDKLVVKPRATGTRLFGSEYFAEEVRRQIERDYGNSQLTKGGLSVRTTLDPKMQIMARRTLMNGLIRYDEKRGWRGPLETIELDTAEWGGVLRKKTPLYDVPEWKIAVVLEAEADAAKLGLRPDSSATGSKKAERREINLSLAGVQWAKWATGPRKGKKITKVTEVLKPGDVVYVEAVKNPETGLASWRLRQFPEISGALVAMDPHTGRVLALVGGFSYAHSQFNRATQAFRQPGSSFKPFVYAAALDNGYTPSSVVMDAPLEIKSGSRIWRPKNYGGKFYGPSTLRLGIERSRNVMTVRLAQDMGMPLVAEYARRFGIYDNMSPLLSMSLGAGETTVLRMTAAYSVIANGGRRVKPTLIDRIQDRYGKTVMKHEERVCEACAVTSWTGQDEPKLVDNREQVLDPMTAYQVTSMMEGVVKRGTATVVAKVGKHLAGKTGTTNDERDAWFVGYSPDLAVGVFIGYDIPRPMGRGSTGGELAAPIFKDFMEQALKATPSIPFRVPKGIKLIPIDRKTGMRASTEATGGVILEAFKPGTGPPDSYDVIDFADDDGRPLTVAPDADRAIMSGSGGLY